MNTFLRLNRGEPGNTYHPAHNTPFWECDLTMNITSIDCIILDDDGGFRVCMIGDQESVIFLTHHPICALQEQNRRDAEALEKARIRELQ